MGDGQEVEVRVEPREDCVPHAVFDQVGGSWCEEVRAGLPVSHPHDTENCENRTHISQNP
jgi:hypothetical protein